MSIKISEYYKQIKNIGVKVADIEGTGGKTTIKNTAGTFQLIDEMIRDLVHIKNEVREERDKNLISVTSDNDANEDTIALGSGGNPAVALVRGKDNTDTQARTRTNNSPTVYTNENNVAVLLSEPALFFALQSACIGIKTVRYGNKAAVVELDDTNLEASS